MVGDRFLDTGNNVIIENIEIDESVVADNYAGAIITVRKVKTK
jgi:hypothetical protein